MRPGSPDRDGSGDGAAPQSKQTTDTLRWTLPSTPQDLFLRTVEHLRVRCLRCLGLGCAACWSCGVSGVVKSLDRVCGVQGIVSQA